MEDRPRASRARRIRARLPPLRGNRGFLAALFTGFGLRLWWIMATTPAGFNRFSDPSEYLSYATQITELANYKIDGHASAFYAPGWPLILSPLVYLARKTDLFSINFAASIMSLVCGMVVVVLGARLAELWFGRRVRNLTVWLIALAPALIGVTSTPLSEAPYTAILLFLLILLTPVLRGPAGHVLSPRATFGFGLVVGVLFLVRGQGLIMLPVAAVLVRYHLGSWSLVRTAALRVLLGVAVFAVPMTIRNGVTVGYWSPSSTDMPAAMCEGHSDGATGGQVTLDHVAFIRQCFWGAPQAAHGQEARWARHVGTKAIGWAATHPRDEVRLTVHKTWLVLGQDRNAGSISYLAELRALPSGWVDPAWRAIEAWRIAALVLAGAALVRERRCRRAPIIWAIPVITMVTLWAGADGARMCLPMLPFFAMLAAALLVPGPSEPEAEPVAVAPEATEPAPA